MTSLSGAEGGKAASMSKHITAMHCKTTTVDYKLLGFRSTNQSNKSSWCESFQRKYLTVLLKQHDMTLNKLLSSSSVCEMFS